MSSTDQCLVKIPNYCTNKKVTLYRLTRNGHKLSVQQSALCCSGCRSVIGHKTKTEYSDIQIENDLIWGVMRTQIKNNWLLDSGTK